MKLPVELINEFVKATKEDPKDQNGATVYGTTVEKDGKLYVMLDGAESPTPVSTTSVAKAGERVMVFVHNHQATITGNVDSPSARDKDLADAAKGASNFMYHDPEVGVEVGDRTTGEWVGVRTRMANDGFYVVDKDGNILAKYLANEVGLGENSETTEVKMCGGKFTITYDAETDHQWVYMYGNKLYLEAPKDVHIMSRNPFDLDIYSRVWMTPDKLHLDGNVYVNEKLLIDLMHPVGKVEMFTVTTDPSELYPGTTWERLEGCFPFATGADEMVGTMSQSLLVSEGEGQVRHLYVAMWKRTA